MRSIFEGDMRYAKQRSSAGGGLPSNWESGVFLTRGEQIGTHFRSGLITESAVT